MLIHWYPGHMAKARRMLVENLKLIDVVVELVDARAPLSTKNPDIDALCAGKSRVLLLNKSDMADAAVTKQWVEYFKSKGFFSMEFVSSGKTDRKGALLLIETSVREKLERLKARGIKKTVRVLVAGIPNVGKSTFINCIAGAGRTNVGDRPGVTKGKQWVSITPYLELMDSPGLLWPKLEDQRAAENLAFLGSVNDETLNVEQLAATLLERLMALCEAELMARYKLLERGASGEELLHGVCKSRGFLQSGGELDTLRGARTVLNEFRGAKIARVTLERPDDLEFSLQ